MRCQKLRSLLPAYSSGECDSRVADHIAQHLTGCANCRREFEAYRTVTDALIALRSPMDTQDSHHMAGSQDANGSNEANVDTTPLPEYQVSEDFNARLLDRIAQERFAEVRSEAHMPKVAPRFMPSQLVPVLGVAVLAVFTTVAVMKQSDQREFAQSEKSAVVEAPVFSDATAVSEFSEQPLGAALGLSEEYMTAQPINNPVLAGERNTSGATAGAGRTTDGLAYTGAGGASSPYRTNNHWHFTRELERAQRFIEISNMLGSGHTYFEVISFHSQRPGVAPTHRSLIIQFGSPLTNPAQSRPQIILRPNSSPAVGQQNPASRMVGESF